MKRLIATVAAALASCLLPGVASAHPLGNFTVNHYARIEPANGQVRVVYVLDMAEIPTFQDRPRADANPDAYADQRAEELRQNLHLAANDQPVALHTQQRTLSFPEGAGGLATTRLDITYMADVQPSTNTEVAFRDDNDPTRIGWREIVARGTASSSVPATDVSDELRHYPDDLLSSPLNVREARLTFLPVANVNDARPTAEAQHIANVSVDSAQASAVSAAAAPLLASTGNTVLDRARRTLAELANGAELTPAFVLFAVAVASVLGAAHALQPGHGKTIVAAYLVGSRGTARHAMFLGATVTATHTAGVYALGLVTLFLSQYILPERLYPILEVVSGLLVVAIGVWLFGQRLLSAVAGRGHEHAHNHAHDHGHSHHDHSHGQTHDHAEGQLDGDREGPCRTHGHSHAPVGGQGGESHAHEPAVRVSWRSLLALGVSGGLLPCPEALMVLLITIAAHRVLFGLLLIVSFSTGLAAVLVGFGLLLVYARGLFARVNLSSGLIPRLLPVASALVIVIAGGVITSQALPQVL